MRQDSKQSREIEPQILHFALDHPQERSKVNNTTSSPSAKNQYGFFEYFSKILFLSFFLNYDKTWGRYLNQFLIPKAGKIFMLFSGPKLEKPVQWPLLWPPINLFLPPACPPAFSPLFLLRLCHNSWPYPGIVFENQVWFWGNCIALRFYRWSTVWTTSYVD